MIFNNARYEKYIRYCYYSGYWYCIDCISIDKIPIPYFALE